MAFQRLAMLFSTAFIPVIAAQEEDDALRLVLLQSQAAMIDPTETREDPDAPLREAPPRGAPQHELLEIDSPEARLARAEIPSQFTGIPQFTIDLDLPADQRWRSVARYYKKELPPMMRSFQNLLDQKMNSSMQALWLQTEAFPDEMSEELAGFAAEFNDTDVTVDRLKLFNSIYEINQGTKACSGILMARPNGNVIHGRDMDYSLPFDVDGRQENWPQVTFVALYTKGATPLVASVNWPGHVGIHTALRFGGWTFEQNTRLDTNSFEANLAAARAGAVSFGFAARQVMLNTTDFDSAVKTLAHLNVMAPMYFVVSGPGPFQGAVVSMDRHGHRDPTITPPIVRLSSANDTWHIVQTNDDLLEPAADSRRPGATLELQSLARDQVSMSTVKSLMTSAPLYNELTVFTWIAESATGAHELYLPSSSFGGLFVPPTVSSKSAVQVARKKIGKSVVWRRTAAEVLAAFAA